jgi:GrpB-like predicted nucleotidyltransferase (UPF0157 family)
VSDEEEPSGLIGGIEKREIVIADYDASWPEKYRTHARRISETLGVAAVRIEHIGSTSVPGLAAKPIVDMLLVVADSANESCYLSKLAALGFELRVREPDFHEHRMFRTPERDVHVHVLSIGSTEVDRYLTFRDRLRGNPGDRRLYEAEKRRLAARPWPDMNAYADAKTECIERILAAESADETSDGQIEP